MGKNPFLIGFADGIFAFKPVFYYGQRSECADLLNSYQTNTILQIQEVPHMTQTINPRKAAIIGCGFVGSATAFTLMQSRLFSELVLLDANEAAADEDLCRNLR